MASISKALRRQVTERAGGRCEYCQTLLVIVVEMEVDHIIPTSAGGRTALTIFVWPVLAAMHLNGIFRLLSIQKPANKFHYLIRAYKSG